MAKNWTVADAIELGGYLLRTKIRAAIEFLDQLYQYGEAGDARIGSIKGEAFEEDMTSLEDVF